MIKPYTKQLSFKKILTECAREQEHSYLSVIETEAEHNFVSNLLSRHQLGKKKTVLQPIYFPAINIRVSQSEDCFWRFKLDFSSLLKILLNIKFKTQCTCVLDQHI